MADRCPVETIRPGDWVHLPSGLQRRVACVEPYEDGSFVVVYEAGEMSKPLRDAAGDTHGARPEPVLKQLAPRRRGQTWEVTRG